jgi:hypothetical protein
MNTESPVYSPGDTAGILRYPARNYVGSTFSPQALLGTTGSLVALTAGVAIGLIWFLGRKK